MSLTLINDMAVQTSWYVYRDRSDYFNGAIDAGDGFFVSRVSGQVNINIAGNGFSSSASVDAEPFTTVIIGPQVTVAGAAGIALSNQLFDTGWYVYGPNGTEVYSGIIHHGQDVLVSNAPAGLCRVDVVTPLLGPIAVTGVVRGQKVTLRVRTQIDPPAGIIPLKP